MTDKEIRHLGKAELLSIIRDQEAELEQLRTQIAQLQTQTDGQILQMEKCGSIAEASLQFNQVFQAAQAAADQYLASIRVKEADAEAAAHRLEAQAKEKAEAQIRAVDEKCQQMETESRTKAMAYWSVLQVQLDQFYKSHEGLKEILKSSGINMQIQNQEGMK